MSDNSGSLLQKVRKFVEKYNNNGFEFSPNLGLIEREIMDDLAEAIHIFEVAEDQNRRKPIPSDLANLLDVHEVKMNLYDKAKDLNRMIDSANVSGLLSDNLTIKKLVDSEKENSLLKSEREQDKTTINTLEHKITALKTTIRLFQNVHPDLRVAISESELEDGEPSSV